MRDDYRTAKLLSEDAISRLMATLESGQSDALKTYLSVMSRFRRYSWATFLLIYSQRPDAMHVAGFHGWLRLHSHVRKGEKGIIILDPMVGRKRCSKDEELAEDQKTRVFGFPGERQVFAVYFQHIPSWSRGGPQLF